MVMPLFVHLFERLLSRSHCRSNSVELALLPLDTPEKVTKMARLGLSATRALRFFGLQVAVLQMVNQRGNGACVFSVKGHVVPLLVSFHVDETNKQPLLLLIRASLADPIPGAWDNRPPVRFTIIRF